MKDSLNLHKRLSIQSLLFANYRPMFKSCQHYYFTVGGLFYKNLGFYLEGCLTCEELVVVTHRGMMGEGDY